MSTDCISPDSMPHTRPGLSPHAIIDATGAASSIAALQSELAALRRTQLELQETVAEERRIHEMIREERDQYRTIIYPPLWNLIPEEELIRFAETCHLEPTEDLHDLLHEIGVYDDGADK